MKKAKITIAGDFGPINRIETLLINKKYNDIFAELKPDFFNTDFIVLNLECPLTKSNKKCLKSGPSIKADPLISNSLKELKISMLTLANNHIFDYGFQGLKDTIEILNASNIETIGAGYNYFDASKIKTKNINGLNFSFVNIAENEFGASSNNSPGFNPINPYINFNQIKNAKLYSDFILVIIHGGNEYFDLPNIFQKEIAHYYIDIGVDVVIFHHSHAISGFEKYNKGFVFYGLGNFLFDWPIRQPDEWYNGAYLELFFGTDNLVDFKLVPFEQCKNKVIISKIDSNSFNEKIKFLSNIIINDELLNTKWLEYLNKVVKYYHYNIYSLNIFEKLLYKFGILKPFIKRKIMQPAFINTIRCESHREALKDIIDFNIF